MLQLIRKASARVNFSSNFRCSAKEAVLLLCSWSTLYIGVSKYKVSWLYFSYFNLSLSTESASTKVNFSWNFRCYAKGALLLLLSWITLYVAISKCIVSWFYFFLFWFPTINPKGISAKGNFSWNFRCSTKETVILLASFVEHPVCSIFKMYRTLILNFWFWFVTIQSVCINVIYSWNLKCSAKDAVLLLLSWSTLYVAISKPIVSLFYLKKKTGFN